MKGLIKRLAFWAATIASAAVLLSGCSGDDGKNGQDAVATTGVVDASKLTADDLKNSALSGKILSASIPGDQPVVKFQVVNKATGKGVAGLRTFAMHIAQLKPESNGSNSYWLNYIADGLPQSAMPAATAVPRNPATDAVTSFNTDGTVKAQGYSVVDHGDGTYTVTFGANIKANTKVIYDASLVHRIAVGVRSVVVPGVLGKTPGAYGGPINPATGAAFPQFLNTNGTALVYDFVPATGAMLTNADGSQKFARDIITIAACNQCHYRIEYGSNNTSGHFGSRPDTKVCVICHTPQLNAITEYGEGDFTSFIHKIHMGEDLPGEETAPLTEELGVNEIKYPQDTRNCTVCHKGADVNNWMTKPSIKACGSCHNTTFPGHKSQTNDSLCLGCHGSGNVSVKTAHTTNDSTPNNPDVPAGLSTFTYAVSTVTINDSKQPVITFTIKKNGANVTLDTAGADKLRRLPLGSQGFKGGPSLRTFFSVPQDNNTAPADFNASITASLTNLWRGLGGTLAQNADGSYTATVTGTVSGTTATAATVPANAKMITTLVYGNFTQAVPFATYSTGNESTTTIPGVVRNTMQATKVATGSTARRAVVTNAKCNACHEQLGIKPSFHSGARNDGATCNLCHTTNGTANGWSYGANTFIHAIHGSSKRTQAYKFAAGSATDNFSTVGYPGVLKNCEACHATGTYDFSASASSSALSKLLYDTVAAGTIGSTGTAVYRNSPYVSAGTYYGDNFSYNVNTGATRQAASTTLVTSPISSVCFSCHDTAAAKAHMETNGGMVYRPRGTAFANYSNANGRVNSSTTPASVEQCLVCHGALSTTNIDNDTTPALKAVHRWW